MTYKPQEQYNGQPVSVEDLELLADIVEPSTASPAESAEVKTLKAGIHNLVEAVRASERVQAVKIAQNYQRLVTKVSGRHKQAGH